MKSIATYAICNNGGIEIYNIEYGIDDKICFAWVWIDKQYKKCYAKIRYTQEGRAYFITRKCKIFLDECMRTD